MSDKPDLHGRKRMRIDKDILSRLPPYSEEAEQGVLGCILLDPRHGIAKTVECFKGDAATFYDLRHRTIFEVLVELDGEDIPIDLILVQQRLKDKGQLEAIGGLAYLSILPDSVPSAANLEYYAKIVREKQFLRNAIQIGNGIVGRVYEHEGEVDELLDDISKDLTKLTTARYTQRTTRITSVVQDCMQDIDRALQKNDGGIDGLSYGFIDLDKITMGMHEAEFIIIAARPSQGKSAMASNIIEHVGIELGIPCAYFSLEMTSKALVNRMIASRSRVNLRNIREGFIAERDFPKITGAAAKLSSAPIYIEACRGVTSLELRAKARMLQQEHGVRLFVIDYLQLVKSGRKREKRHEEIQEISGDVFTMASELNVPVIGLSQLSRDVEKEKNRRPRLSDLRESSSLEQDADTVLMLHPEKDNDDGQDREIFDARPVECIVAKQRAGPAGTIKLTFIKGITRFQNATRTAVEPELPRQGNRFPD